ncbi:metallophosphoesterase family protein [Rhodohalobacter sp. 8-1]|uniref:metallophosphoesterase family protein n=1 Tax=Rhodohalobacter sp. 8-1 TaxID=3131972 RepID=UPI0030EF0096
MKIFHFSDIHAGSKKHFRQENLLHIIDEINNGGYDLAIFTGDATNEGQRDEYELAREMLDKIEVPLISIPGNHDARSGGIKLFEEYIGPQNGVKVFGDAVVIYVNSAIGDSNDGRVGRVKFNMLKKALNDHSDKPIKIVAIHHHILPIPMSGRERNVLANAGDLLDLIQRADVDLVVSGHRHYPNVYKVENTVFINAGTASSAKTRYGDVNSYCTIEIDDKENKVTTKRLNGQNTTRNFKRKSKRIFTEFGDREFRAVQLSNTYFSESSSFLSNHFDQALKSLKTLDPDLLIHCGGIVKEGTPRDYDFAIKQLNKLDLPMIFTPAARDINYIGYHLFNQSFGELDQSFKTDKFLFQGLSTPQYDSSIGVVGESERKVLLELLKDSPQDFRTVFLHHNIIPIPHSREKGLLEDAGDLLRELVDADINLVLTGTSYHPYATRVGETVIVNVNSLSSAYQRSRFGNSFNMIDIYEKAIVVSEVNALWGEHRFLGIWERNER